MIKKIICGTLFLLFLFILTAIVPGCSRKDDNADKKTGREQMVTTSAFVGSAACVACHGKVDKVRSSGFHKSIDCEKCHGGGALHLTDPIVYNMRKPYERSHCASCHANDSAKTAGIKQIDFEKHNPGNRCVNCHDAHNGGYGKLAGNSGKISSSACVLCHAKINKMRTGGVHKGVECQSCHAGWEQHLDDPRSAKPQKSSERAFCGKCHGKGMASASGKIKQIDLKEHNPDNKCIECHNPHSPWD